MKRLLPLIFIAFILPAFSQTTSAPRPKFTRHTGDARPAATFVRTGQFTTIGVEDELPILKPTLVTLDLKNASAQSAADAIGKSLNFPLASQPTGYFSNDDLPPINISLDKKPALEALLRFCSQTGTKPHIDDQRRFVVYENDSDKAVGAWCVSGPFAFIITRIERTIPLARWRDHVHPPAASIHLEMLAEPRLNVLAYPAALDVELMQDEAGNKIALGESSVPVDPPSPIAVQTERRLSIAMQLPEHPGNRIKILRATGRFIYQTKSVPLNLALGKDIIEMDVGKMKLTAGPLLRGTQRCSFALRFRRNELPEETWKIIAAAIPCYRPGARDEKGNPLDLWGVNEEPVNDSVSVTYSWDIKGPLPATLPIDIPIECQQVIVPLVFRDLMLP